MVGPSTASRPPHRLLAHGDPHDVLRRRDRRLVAELLDDRGDPVRAALPDGVPATPAAGPVPPPTAYLPPPPPGQCHPAAGPVPPRRRASATPPPGQCHPRRRASATPCSLQSCTSVYINKSIYIHICIERVRTQLQRKPAPWLRALIYVYHYAANKYLCKSVNLCMYSGGAHSESPPLAR
jgi:hypothetical protein